MIDRRGAAPALNAALPLNVALAPLTPRLLEQVLEYPERVEGIRRSLPAELCRGR